MKLLQICWLKNLEFNFRRSTENRASYGGGANKLDNKCPPRSSSNLTRSEKGTIVPVWYVSPSLHVHCRL